MGSICTNCDVKITIGGTGNKSIGKDLVSPEFASNSTNSTNA